MFRPLSLSELRARSRRAPAAHATREARAQKAAASPRLRGNPYLFLGGRPFREARLRSYVLGQHRAGRPLSAIQADPYVRCCGGESLLWRVLVDPRTIHALERDVREAIAAARPRADGRARIVELPARAVDRTP